MRFSHFNCKYGEFMYKNIFSILVAVAILAFAGCSSSDNSTNPPVDGGSYFPIKTGSFWAYNSTETDPETNEITPSRDSIIIKEQSTEEGKLAFKFENYIDGTYSDDTYQYTENDQLFVLLQSILPTGGTLPIPVDQIPNQWVKIADNNATKWDVFSLDLSNIPFDFGGLSLDMSGNLKVEGTKGDKVVVEVMGKEYTAQKYTINSKINATANYQGLPISIGDVIIPTHYYYVQGIGLVKTVTESTEISVLTFKFKTPESESILVNYNVVK